MAEPRRFLYPNEIRQMLYVHGEMNDADEPTVNLIEDLVRIQVIEIVSQARALAARRNSKAINTDDLVFLIRHDAIKVNRIRSYLSWKDVRKKAREQDPAETIVDLDVTEDQPDKGLKSQKAKVKIPWDVTHVYAEGLPENSDDEDEGDREAYEYGKMRLKMADDLTKKMTPEEYSRYADARQASFTFRKSKRFRDFINFTAYADASPNDEVLEVFGYLAYEVVRSLCEAAQKQKTERERRIFLEAQERRRRSIANVARREEDKKRRLSLIEEHSSPPKGKRKSPRKGGRQPSLAIDVDLEQRDSQQDSDGSDDSDMDLEFLQGPFSRIGRNNSVVFSAITPFTSSFTPATPLTTYNLYSAAPTETPVSAAPSTPQIPDQQGLFFPIESASAITVEDVEIAYAKLQREGATKRFAGTRNWRGGSQRMKVEIVQAV